MSRRGDPQGRICEWCEGPLPPGSRRDALTCSKACRQAKHRFKVSRAELVVTDRPLRFAYADPPYPGLAGYYPEGEEVDHAELVQRLGPYDGWALSTSSKALREVWALCPEGTRLCIWDNGGRPNAASRSARRSYEALLVYGGRRGRVAVVQDLCDVLHYRGRQYTHPNAMIGMKPAPFCEWMFRLLGARRGDHLDDLFPGSGAVTRAWRLYTSPPPGGDTTLDPRHVAGRPNEREAA